MGDFHLPEQAHWIEHGLNTERLERYAYQQSSSAIGRWFIKEQTKVTGLLKALVPLVFDSIPTHPGNQPPLKWYQPLARLFRCGACVREFSSEAPVSYCPYCGQGDHLATVVEWGESAGSSEPSPTDYAFQNKKLWGCLAVLFGPWLVLLGFAQLVQWLGPSVYPTVRQTSTDR